MSHGDVQGAKARTAPDQTFEAEVFHKFTTAYLCKSRILQAPKHQPVCDQTTGMHVRPATAADMEAIGTLATAAFTPDTDAISRRLFPAHLQPPDAPLGSAARQWRLARKTKKLQDERINIIVAVDDELGGEIVGFSLWEVPARNASDGPVLPSAVSSPGLDQAAFDEMQAAVGDDIRKHFGESGTDNLWRA
jgi:hypothetical protein